jgi:DNA invertase Pin-like site-specific DNA recombinase
VGQRSGNCLTHDQSTCDGLMTATLTLPKAAQQILAMPGVESLEREPDGWCCHLRHGWSTEALSGGGTIVDTSLATIRDHVKGARLWDGQEQQLEASEAQEATSSPRKARKVGYGRVSTEHQSEDQQKAQLEAAGCTEVITETISSGRKERPGLARVLQELQPGDTLVVCKLDRMARSLRELLNISADLETRGVNLRVLDQAIDTSTPAGRLLYQVLGSVAEFERSLAIERTRESVEHRRRTGGNLGGRHKSYTAEQHRLGLRLKAEGESVSGVARALGISRATAGRLLQEPLQEATS